MYRYLTLFICFLLVAINLQGQNSCNYTLILNDAGGNGWEGAEITFAVETTDQAVLTLSGATDTIDLPVVEGDSISIRYTTGQNNAENSFQLIDSDGQVLIAQNNPQQGVRFSDFASCPICPAIVLGSQMNVDSFDTSVVLDLSLIHI